MAKGCKIRRSGARGDFDGECTASLAALSIIFVVVALLNVFSGEIITLVLACFIVSLWVRYLIKRSR